MVAFTSLLKNDTEVAESVKDVLVTVPPNKYCANLKRKYQMWAIFAGTPDRCRLAKLFRSRRAHVFVVYNEWTWGERCTEKLQMLEELHTVRGPRKHFASSYEEALYISKSSTSGPNPVSFHMQLAVCERLSLVQKSLQYGTEIYAEQCRWTEHGCAQLRRQNVLISLPSTLALPLNH